MLHIKYLLFYIVLLLFTCMNDFLKVSKLLILLLLQLLLLLFKLNIEVK